jgi:dipeptidyl aminopeptidase/acylaminoacyl peptidase
MAYVSFFKRIGFNFIPLAYSDPPNLVQDCQNALHLASSYIRNDKDQVYLWGVSRGGYVGFNLLESTKMFSRAVICVAPFDLSVWKPTENVKGYFTQDPALDVWLISTPTLLVYGLKDEIVPASQGVLAGKVIRGAKLVKVPFGHDLASYPEMVAMVKKWFMEG